MENEIIETSHQVLKGHTTSTRICGFSTGENGSKLLFTAGGKLQLKCWKWNDLAEIFYLVSEMEGDRMKHIGNRTESSMLKTSRILDISVLPMEDDIHILFCGRSDKILKVLMYEESTSQFISASEIDHGATIFSVCSLQLGIGFITASGGSDGIINIYYGTYRNKKVHMKKNVLYSYIAHQSGVDSIDMKLVNNSIYIISGGDDSHIHITQISATEIGDECIIEPLNQKYIPTMHFSSIKGIYLNFPYIYSTGPDHRLMKNYIDTENFDLVYEDSFITEIAHASDLDYFNIGGENYVVIVGEGMQVIKV
eukprot:TRINITY_DN3421_c0_g2_i1.p1 TRINITY_DN3421_c0_g2~~TRINITY_DN3421_c0_g2_i1.p1  ORF type:complete len:310 (-),score=48.41 TRINITY_DN3421_c0_g2_i1:69-998(-)